METQLTRRCLHATALLLLLLTSCRNVGLDELDRKSPLEDTKEEKDEDNWWDHFTGRKKSSFDSKQWQDYYKPPAEETAKPHYCGFWGQCAGDTAPAPDACNFYGNCKGQTPKQGWW